MIKVAVVHSVFLFFFLASFCHDWVSVSCFTGQLAGIGTVFILASLQMCKVQRRSPLASQGRWVVAFILTHGRWDVTVSFTCANSLHCVLRYSKHPTRCTIGRLGIGIAWPWFWRKLGVTIFRQLSGIFVMVFQLVINSAVPGTRYCTPRLVLIYVRWRTHNTSKQFPAMHVKFPNIICINFAVPTCKTNRRWIIASKNFRRPLKPFCRKESLC